MCSLQARIHCGLIPHKARLVTALGVHGCRCRARCWCAGPQSQRPTTSCVKAPGLTDVTRGSAVLNGFLDLMVKSEQKPQLETSDLRFELKPRVIKR